MRIARFRPRWVALGAPIPSILALLAGLFIVWHTRTWDYAPIFIVGPVVMSLAFGPIVGGVFTLAQSALNIAFSIFVTGDFATAGVLAVLGAVVALGVSVLLGYISGLTVSFRLTVEELETLRGILPMCARCKKIRDSAGYWQEVEAYISSHADVIFSHGLCEECISELYPEYAETKTDPETE